jgi:hypothetical protein
MAGCVALKLLRRMRHTKQQTRLIAAPTAQQQQRDRLLHFTCRGCGWLINKLSVVRRGSSGWMECDGIICDMIVGCAPGTECCRDERKSQGQ